MKLVSIVVDLWQGDEVAVDFSPWADFVVPPTLIRHNEQKVEVLGFVRDEPELGSWSDEQVGAVNESLRSGVGQPADEDESWEKIWGETNVLSGPAAG